MPTPRLPLSSTDPHPPQQPLEQSPHGPVRFRKNVLVRLLLRHHPETLRQILGNPALDTDSKRQFVQLLGLSPQHCTALGFPPLFTRTRVQAPASHKAAHPVQWLHVDAHGRVRFRANAVVNYLLNTGPLDLNQLVTHGRVADMEQLGMLIGYSLSGAPSYVRSAMRERAEAEWNERPARQAREASKQQQQHLDQTLPTPAAGARPRL